MCIDVGMMRQRGEYANNDGMNGRVEHHYLMCHSRTSENTHDLAEMMEVVATLVKYIYWMV